MNYRRSQTAGGTFFFTLVTFQRKPLFAEVQNINLLRSVISTVKLAHPFKIEAFILLPDHLHAIWTLPINDQDFSTRWRLIKSNFTRQYMQGKGLPDKVRKLKAEQCVWQRRFWEHQISDQGDFNNHIDYIHYNPVKHGYVKSAHDWPHSSFHRYVKAGMYEKNWGTGKMKKFNEGVGKE